MTSMKESIVRKHPRLSTLASYDSHLRNWIRTTSVKDLELFKSYGFRNSHSLYDIVINLDLIETIVSRWDMKNRVFRFGTVEICPTTEEYARLIGVPYDCENVIFPCFELSFKQRLSKTLGVKRNF